MASANARRCWLLALAGAACTNTAGELTTPASRDGGVTAPDAGQTCPPLARDAGLPPPDRAPVVTCANASQCERGYTCESGVCVSGPFGEFGADCTDASDCTFWQRCDQGLGRCIGDPSYMSWDVETNDCTRERPFRVVAPQGEGPYPVFVYLTGTFGNHANETVQSDLLIEMARRGFVAISADYANGFPAGIDDSGAGSNNSPQLIARAKCIFDRDVEGGLVNRIDASRESLGADSSLGVAIAGHSLGAMTALAAQPSHPSIVAMYLTGAGNDQKHLEVCGFVRDYTTYLNAYARVNTRPEILRIVDGEEDQFFINVAEDPPFCYEGDWTRYPFDATSLRDMLNEMTTGLDCPTDCQAGRCGIECLSPTGSGWVLVGNDEALQTGHADHTYWLSNYDTWATTDAEWGRDRNLDWMLCMQQNGGAACGDGQPRRTVEVFVPIGNYQDTCATVTVTLSRGGVVLESHDVLVEIDECRGGGIARIETKLEPGDYDLSVKQFHRLGRMVPVTIGDGLTRTEVPPLDQVGDANGDNVIGDADRRTIFMSFMASYTRTCGAVLPGVPSVGAEGWWMADVNGDGEVGDADIEAYQASAGQTGEGVFGY